MQQEKCEVTPSVACLSSHSSQGLAYGERGRKPAGIPEAARQTTLRATYQRLSKKGIYKRYQSASLLSVIAIIIITSLESTGFVRHQKSQVWSSLLAAACRKRSSGKRTCSTALSCILTIDGEDKTGLDKIKPDPASHEDAY